MIKIPGGEPTGVMGASQRPAIEEQLVEFSLAELQSRPNAQFLPLPAKNPPTLPLSDLEPAVFERVVAEMVSLDGGPTVHFYGRQGQKQYGLDIYEERSDGTRALYQVKRFQSISPAEIRQAVVDYAGPPRSGSQAYPERRFNPKLFVVVTSALVDNDTANVDAIAKLQTEYGGDIRIAVWGAEAVSRKLRGSAEAVFAIFGEAWAGSFAALKRRTRQVSS